MADLPSGTVTFLFTDLVTSTRLWEEHPEAMRAALERHDAIVRTAIESHHGHVFSTGGDGFGAAFPRVSDALLAATEAQVALAAEDWSSEAALSVRMGVHTGETAEHDGDYFGPVVNRAARLMAVAHGGQVVCSRATAEMAGSALPLRSLGEHRLRDLAAPQEVFQVGDATFPPLLSLDAYPGNLRIELSSFVGREREVAEVVELLGERRLVTLTGVGGVGKTRLAVQVAGEVLPRFKDGAWLCELAPVRDPAAVVDAVAGAFLVTARPGLSLEQSLIAYLGDQKLLVVLDNCEHVLRPVAALVTAIEAACPNVRVLATSREGLSVRGEQMWAVPSLEVPGDATDPEAVGATEAVRLFEDRARGVKAGFVVDASNAEGVAQVCTRLDGVPLAIELAAARIGAMTPTELARRLDRRFRLLAGGDRVAIERHQTLRATIDWSYDLLSEPEQGLLIRLSVFAGGFTLEAAEAVCAGDPIEVDDVLELLATLVARSLVVASTAGAETRYRLLETIRQYGEERLGEARETDSVRARHAEYYTEFAGTATRGIYGPGQLEWGARLAREHDNLLAAMAFALDTQDLERAMGLLSATPWSGIQIDRPVVFDPAAVLALPDAAQHPGSARALIDSAWESYRIGDFGLALELIDRALATEKRLGPGPNPLAVGLEATLGSSVRAAIASSTGTLAESAEWQLDAATRAGAIGQHGLKAAFLGVSAVSLGWVDSDAAIARATEGLTLARRNGVPSAIAVNLRALAMAFAQSDPQRASAFLAEANAIAYESTGDLSVAVFATGRLADWPGALRIADRLLDIDRRSGTAALVILSGTFNVIARGLAEIQPETAAVLQGVVRGLAVQMTPASAPPAPPAAGTGSNPVVELITQVRRETSQLLVQAIGEPRMRELRAQGEAMNRDQATAYARTHIHEYLATLAPEAT